MKTESFVRVPLQLQYSTEGPGKGEGVQEHDMLISSALQAGCSHLPSNTVSRHGTNFDDTFICGYFAVVVLHRRSW